MKSDESKVAAEAYLNNLTMLPSPTRAVLNLVQLRAAVAKGARIAPGQSSSLCSPAECLCQRYDTSKTSVEVEILAYRQGDNKVCSYLVAIREDQDSMFLLAAKFFKEVREESVLACA